MLAAQPSERGQGGRDTALPCAPGAWWGTGELGSRGTRALQNVHSQLRNKITFKTQICLNTQRGENVSTILCLLEELNQSSWLQSVHSRTKIHHGLVFPR